MTEQEENELICEKLLGWTRHDSPYAELRHQFPWFSGIRYTSTPSFATWADAGLILEALAAVPGPGDHVVNISYRKKADHIPGIGNWIASFSPYSRQLVRLVKSTSGPLAIRGAALEYIKCGEAMNAQPSKDTKLTDFKAGDRVRYVPYHAHGDIRHSDCENGRVTSVNDTYVFVRFRPEGETSEACLPDQLVKS